MTKDTITLNMQDPVAAIDEIREALARQGYVATLWHIGDVQDQRPDLDDGQSMVVLKQCLRYYDADIGINWEVIRFHAEELFPEPE